MCSCQGKARDTPRERRRKAVAESRSVDRALRNLGMCPVREARRADPQEVRGIGGISTEQFDPVPSQRGPAAMRGAALAEVLVENSVAAARTARAMWGSLACGDGLIEAPATASSCGAGPRRGCGPQAMEPDPRSHRRGRRTTAGSQRRSAARPVCELPPGDAATTATAVRARRAGELAAHARRRARRATRGAVPHAVVPRRARAPWTARSTGRRDARLEALRSRRWAERWAARRRRRERSATWIRRYDGRRAAASAFSRSADECWLECAGVRDARATAGVREQHAGAAQRCGPATSARRCTASVPAGRSQVPTTPGGDVSAAAPPAPAA